MSLVSNSRSKRRRLSSPEGGDAVVKRSREPVRHEYGDTHAAGNAFVHNGDNLHFHHGASSLQLEIHQIQSSLAFPGMHDRYESLREAQDGTYRWILHQNPESGETSEAGGSKGGAALSKNRQCMEKFFRWYETGAGIYWISGKPGSGKSTLMKFLVEHIGSCDTMTQHPNLIILSVFFWIGGESLQRSKLGCLKSLLWQLLQNPIAQQVTVQKCRSYFRNAWSESRMEAALLAILKQLDDPILLFIDGLDEGNDHEELLDLLSTISAIANVKACVSSRPEPIFAKRLSSLPNLKLHELNSDDIQRVVRKKLLENPIFVALSSNSNLCYQEIDVRSLAQEIEWKSEGVFLWVHLVIKDLLRGISNNDDLGNLRLRLRRLPGDIIELYQDMLQRSRDDASLYQEDVSLYLSLVLHRKFDLVEFCFAIDGKLRNKYLQPSILDGSTETMTDIPCDVVKTWIQARTAGLVDVVEDRRRRSLEKIWRVSQVLDTQSSRILKHRSYTVEVVHRTANDFLLNTAAGNALLRPSADMDTKVVQICFETMLICELVLPGLQRVCVGIDQVMPVFTCVTCRDEDIYAGVRSKGKEVLRFLYHAGLVQPENDFVCMTSIYLSPLRRRIASAFPSSVHSQIDLAPILLLAGRYRAMRAWLTENGSLNDTRYLSTLLAPLMARHLQEQPYGGYMDRELRNCFEFLIDHDADFLQAITSDGEESLFLPGDNLHSSESRDDEDCLERFWRKQGFQHAHCAVRYISPCHLCHNVWFQHTLDRDQLLELWGNFCLSDPPRVGLAGKDVQLRDHLEVPRLADDRIMVIAANNGTQHGYRVLRAVSEVDSHLLIETIQGHKNSHFVIFEICNFCLDYSLMGDYQCVLDEVCGRSPIVSFAAAMRHMGKSEKTIHTFYEKEAKRMALEPAKTQEGWKEWYWGSDVSPTRNATG